MSGNSASAALPVADRLLLDLPSALRGGRVVVRPFGDSDAGALAEAVAQSRERLKLAEMPWIAEWDEPGRGQIYVRQCQVKWAARDEFPAGIFDRATGRLLGATGLHRIDWRVPSVEIGYWIRADAEGQGYISEAVALMTEFAIVSLHAQRVRIRCDAANARSAAVPRRLGFTHEATLRNECRRNDGELRDTFEFGMTPADFHPLRAGPWKAYVASS